MRAICPDELILLDFIILTIFLRSTNNKARHYAVLFTSLMLRPPSELQMHIPEQCPRIPTIYFLLSGGENKFHASKYE
jgi:hypothetical protein